LRATEFEFRFRFLFIMAFFVCGFWCYAIDPVNISAMLAERLMGHPIGPGAAGGVHVFQAILAFGAGLAVLAALTRTWAAAYLQSGVVHDTKLHGEGLVADGPYRYVRNPLYLGGVLLATGFGMAASRLGFAVMVGGLTVFYYRLIAREEWLLSQTQGESYSQFLKAVPRLIPSLSPQVAAGGLIPRWGQAVVGETFMWFFAVALICFAATLSQRLFVGMMVAGLCASVLMKAAVLRRRHHNTPTPAKAEK
jgi:protein-S-isoprenylcysteine O-methyltransferase Ste14